MSTVFNELFTSIKKQLGVVISGNRKILEKIEEMEDRKSSEINQSYTLGYEKGVEEGRREAIMRKYTPNEIREIMGLPRIEKPEIVKECNPMCDFDAESRTNGTVIPSLYNLILEDESMEGSRRRQQYINMNVFQCIYHLENRVLELDRRTK